MRTFTFAFQPSPFSPSCLPLPGNLIESGFINLISNSGYKKVSVHAFGYGSCFGALFVLKGVVTWGSLFVSAAEMLKLHEKMIVIPPPKALLIQQ